MYSTNELLMPHRRPKGRLGGAVDEGSVMGRSKSGDRAAPEVTRRTPHERVAPAAELPRSDRGGCAAVWHDGPIEAWPSQGRPASGTRQPLVIGQAPRGGIVGSERVDEPNPDRARRLLEPGGAPAERGQGGDAA